MAFRASRPDLIEAAPMTGFAARFPGDSGYQRPDFIEAPGLRSAPKHRDGPRIRLPDQQV